MPLRSSSRGNGREGLSIQVPEARNVLPLSPPPFIGQKVIEWCLNKENTTVREEMKLIILPAETEAKEAERVEVHRALDIATLVKEMTEGLSIAAAQGPQTVEVTVVVGENAQENGVMCLGRQNRRKRICGGSWSAEDKRLPKVFCLAPHPAPKRRER